MHLSSYLTVSLCENTYLYGPRTLLYETRFQVLGVCPLCTFSFYVTAREHTSLYGFMFRHTLLYEIRLRFSSEFKPVHTVAIVFCSVLQCYVRFCTVLQCARQCARRAGAVGTCSVTS